MKDNRQIIRSTERPQKKKKKKKPTKQTNKQTKNKQTEKTPTRNRWTIRSTKRQVTKGPRSAGRPKQHWKDDIVGQQGATKSRTAKGRES